MDITFINAFLLPLFATWFIPVTIRDAETGNFKGFLHKSFYLLFTVLFVLESFLVIQRHGLSPYSVNSIILYTVLPIVGAVLFVKYTQKKLFGNEIRFTKWW